MIDLEDQLRESLAAYAASVTPTPMAEGPVADDFARVTTMASRRPGWRPILAAAAAVILIAGGLVALRQSRRVPEPTSTSVPTTLALSEGTWQTVPQAPLSPREYPSVVWTGTEFIVWGGERNNVGFNDGAAFDPATNRWRKIASDGRAQAGATAVWAGDRMIVLAGAGGEAYDPATDTWTSLPPLPADHGRGITDTVWTGSELLGVGYERSASGSGGVSTLRVWSLDAARSTWTAIAPQQLTPEMSVAGRLMSGRDQFETINPIATSDGFVVWDGVGGGWQYSITTGWRQLPRLATFDGRPIRESNVVWHAGQLHAVISVGPKYGNDPDRIDIASFDGQQWGPSRAVTDGWIVYATAYSVGTDLIVLGAGTATPLLVDPAAPAARAALMTGFPIDSAMTQGAAWSGSQFLVWGGQDPVLIASDDAPQFTAPPTGGGTSTGADTRPYSNQGAIWTP